MASESHVGSTESVGWETSVAIESCTIVPLCGRARTAKVRHALPAILLAAVGGQLIAVSSETMNSNSSRDLVQSLSGLPSASGSIARQARSRVGAVLAMILVAASFISAESDSLERQLVDISRLEGEERDQAILQLRNRCLKIGTSALRWIEERPVSESSVREVHLRVLELLREARPTQCLFGALEAGCFFSPTNHAFERGRTGDVVCLGFRQGDALICADLSEFFPEQFEAAGSFTAYCQSLTRPQHGVEFAVAAFWIRRRDPILAEKLVARGLAIYGSAFHSIVRKYLAALLLQRARTAAHEGRPWREVHMFAARGRRITPNSPGVRRLETAYGAYANHAGTGPLLRETRATSVRRSGRWVLGNVDTEDPVAVARIAGWKTIPTFFSLIGRKEPTRGVIRSRGRVVGVLALGQAARAVLFELTGMEFRSTVDWSGWWQRAEGLGPARHYQSLLRQGASGSSVAAARRLLQLDGDHDVELILQAARRGELHARRELLESVAHLISNRHAETLLSLAKDDAQLAIRAAELLSTLGNSDGLLRIAGILAGDRGDGRLVDFVEADAVRSLHRVAPQLLTETILVRLLGHKDVRPRAAAIETITATESLRVFDAIRELLRDTSEIDGTRMCDLAAISIARILDKEFDLNMSIVKKDASIAKLAVWARIARTSLNLR